MAVRDLGIVTAYGYAVEGGYTGTEQEFTALLGDLALTVEDLENMTVSVTTLEPTEQATASYSDGVLSLGIPRGRNGEVTQEDLDEQLENYATNEDLYGAYIVKSASGDIASFNDGGDDIPMKSVNVTITPKQSGSGDPSPDNVRPITGTSTANVHVDGKNLFPLPINISGTDYTNRFTLADYPALADFFKTLQQSIGKTVVLSCVATGTPIGVQIGTMRIFANGETLINVVPNTPVVLPEKNYLSADSVYIYGSTNPTTIKDVQLEYGSTVTDFEPYNGHTTPVPLGQTVYGGTVDVVSGESADGMYYASLTGNEAWVDSGSTYLMYSTPYAVSQYPSAGMCSHFRFGAGNLGGDSVFAGINANTGKYLAFTKSFMQTLIGVTTLAEFKTYLQTQNANGTPVQVAYWVKEPTSFTTDPVSVPSLLGTNNVWADCGSVEVEYRADPTLAYNEILPNLASVIAPVEKTNIATRNYTTGALLIVNNMLYKVTANIANGGTITPNTNVTATTLAEIISAL